MLFQIHVVRDDFLLLYLFMCCLILGLDMSNIDWITTEIEVRVRETHDDPGLIHQIGIVRNFDVCLTLTLFLKILDFY